MTAVTTPAVLADEAIAVLRELVQLKDGPRDRAYKIKKDYVWERARQVLLSLDGTE